MAKLIIFANTPRSLMPGMTWSCSSRRATHFFPAIEFQSKKHKQSARSKVKHQLIRVGARVLSE